MYIYIYESEILVLIILLLKQEWSYNGDKIHAHLLGPGPLAGPGPWPPGPGPRAQGPGPRAPGPAPEMYKRKVYQNSFVQYVRATLGTLFVGGSHTCRNTCMYISMYTYKLYIHTLYVIVYTNIRGYIYIHIYIYIYIHMAVPHL